MQIDEYSLKETRIHNSVSRVNGIPKNKNSIQLKKEVEVYSFLKCQSLDHIKGVIPN